MSNAAHTTLFMRYDVGSVWTPGHFRSEFATVSTGDNAPTKYIVNTSLTCATTGTAAVAANHYASRHSAIGIENTDVSNYVTVTYTARTAATACTVLLGPRENICLQNVVYSTAVTITANTAACICKIFSYGI